MVDDDRLLPGPGLAPGKREGDMKVFTAANSMMTTVIIINTPARYIVIHDKRCAPI